MSRVSPWRQSLIPIGLALFATWPMALSPFRRMVGHEDADVWNHAWGAWCYWESIRTGDWSWHTSWMGWPQGGTLWYIDPLGATLTAPLVPLIGVQGAWNALVLFYMALAAAGAAAIARRISGPGPHVYVASVVVAFGPYLLSQLHNGVSEVVNLGPSLFAIAAADAAFRQGGNARWAALAGWLALTVLGSFYYGIATGIAVATLGIVWLARKPNVGELGRAAIVAAVVGVFAVCLKEVIEYTVEAPDALVFRHDEAMAASMQLVNGVDPRTFLMPFGFQSLDLKALGRGFVYSGYLGLVALPMAVWGLRRTRRWDMGAAALMLVICSLGPKLFFDQAWVKIGDSPIPLPFSLALLLLPPQGVTHVIRLVGPGVAIVGALAASALAKRSSRWVGLAFVAVWLDMVVLGASPWPLPRTPVLDTEAAEVIRDVAVEGLAVLDLPGAVSNTMAISRYFVLQTVHRRPIPYTPRTRAYYTPLADGPTFRVLAMASEFNPSRRKALALGFENVELLDREELARRGIGWVVVHRELERGSEKIELTEQLLEAMYGPPVVYGCHAVYIIRGTGSVLLEEEWRRELQTTPAPQLQVLEARRAFSAMNDIAPEGG